MLYYRHTEVQALTVPTCFFLCLIWANKCSESVVIRVPTEIFCCVQHLVCSGWVYSLKLSFWPYVLGLSVAFLYNSSHSFFWVHFLAIYAWFIGCLSLQRFTLILSFWSYVLGLALQRFFLDLAWHQHCSFGLHGYSSAFSHALCIDWPFPWHYKQSPHYVWLVNKCTAQRDLHQGASLQMAFWIWKVPECFIPHSTVRSESVLSQRRIGERE